MAYVKYSIKNEIILEKYEDERKQQELEIICL